jgi:hypothetical protein
MKRTKSLSLKWQTDQEDNNKQLSRLRRVDFGVRDEP